MLLLSATPYKMYTLPEEESSEDEDHYADFLGVTHFLMDPAEARRFDDYLAIFAWHSKNPEHDGRPGPSTSQAASGASLVAVTCRTERLADTPNRMGMLADRGLAYGVELTERDLGDYTTLTLLAGCWIQGTYWSTGSRHPTLAELHGRLQAEARVSRPAPGSPARWRQ